jgi:hypothetical protein
MCNEGLKMGSFRKNMVEIGGLVGIEIKTKNSFIYQKKLCLNSKIIPNNP